MIPQCLGHRGVDQKWWSRKFCKKIHIQHHWPSKHYVKSGDTVPLRRKRAARRHCLGEFWLEKIRNLKFCVARISWSMKVGAITRTWDNYPSYTVLYICMYVELYVICTSHIGTLLTTRAHVTPTSAPPSGVRLPPTGVRVPSTGYGTYIVGTLHMYIREELRSYTIVRMFTYH